MTIKKTKRSERIAFRLNYEDYQKFRAACAEIGTTPSAWLRDRIVASVAATKQGDDA